MRGFHIKSNAESLVYGLIRQENKSNDKYYFIQNVRLSELGVPSTFYSVSTDPNSFRTFILNRIGTYSKQHCEQLINLVINEDVDVSETSVDLLKITIDKNKDNMKNDFPQIEQIHSALELNGEQHYTSRDEKALAFQLLHDWAKSDCLKKMGIEVKEVRLNKFNSDNEILDFIKKEI